MKTRLWIATALCLVATDLFAQAPPANAPSREDAIGRRRWRDMAVEYIPSARPLVEMEEYGDIAATVLLGTSRDNGEKLVTFHASGGLGKIRPKEFLQAVIRRPECSNEVLIWGIEHGEELADPEKFDEFVKRPEIYGMRLQSLATGVAESKKQPPPQPEQPPAAPHPFTRYWPWGASILALFALVCCRKRYGRG